MSQTIPVLGIFLVAVLGTGGRVERDESVLVSAVIWPCGEIL